ncbi:hypothetical protein GF420_06125 [candidate division GN15 bacterium]|nr:hypothetical protein [candidate division GN15 bacterium]
MTRFLSIMGLVCLIGPSGTDQAAAQCADSVVIDSVSYQVPDIWCDRMVDSTDLARPADLVRLPDTLTYQDYRIYVTPATRDAFVAMAEAAAEDSIVLQVDSGFRSKSFQRRLIARRLAEGKPFDSIARFVAPPGYSEHHTGRALDLVPSDPSFVDSPAYDWLCTHARNFGFIESYPEDSQQDIPWEPWHWWYLGPIDQAQ